MKFLYWFLRKCSRHHPDQCVYAVFGGPNMLIGDKDLYRFERWLKKVVK